MFTDSIRWRLQLWLGILLTGLLGAFGATSWQLEKTQRIRRLDDELARRAAALGEGIRPPESVFSRRPPGPPPEPGRRPGPRDEGRRPPPEDDGFSPGRWSRDERPDPHADRVPEPVKALFPADGPEGYYYAIWTGMSGRQRKSANAPAEIPLPSGRGTQTQFRDRAGLREAYHFTEMGECVLAGRPVAGDVAAMKPVALRLFLIGLGVLALGLGGGWWLTSRSIRPIEQIAAAARRISGGNLSERIPIAKPGNELGELAEVLNTTFARLEESFAQQKRFTADASHELRTPLTVLITEIQSALSRERTAEDYKEALAGNLDTARRMKRLTESLLELARLDAGVDGGEGMPYDAAEVAGQVLAKLRPLAEARGTKFEVELAPARTCGNPERLALVISNLVENAIHHGKPGGRVRVSTAEDAAGGCLLEVADDGPGIAGEDLPHLFERFYRADKSRSGSGGRYGLGLAICKGMTEAEGGTISVASEPGKGAVFTVRLPKPGAA